jgi:nitroreductase
MDVIEAIHGRRSVRSYDPKPEAVIRDRPPIVWAPEI